MGLAFPSLPHGFSYSQQVKNKHISICGIIIIITYIYFQECYIFKFNKRDL